MRILVVDDEKIKRITLADDLASQGHEVVAAAEGAEALGKLKQERFDVVVTDLKMPGIDGLELLKRIKEGPPSDVHVILMTAYGSIPVAVDAVKKGAYDFITKPFRNEDIFPLIARIERERRAARPPARRPEPAGTDVDQAIIGRSQPIARVKRMVEICSRSDANVLLCGETGAGKDLIATVIHRNSHREGFPFVKVGCTLFPPNLIESELYGHEKGSFTGAEQKRPGRFDLAEGGSLYLDDVDDIPLEQQSKLLRAIEEKVFERVGGSTPITADVRIIASTKRNLLDKIAEGTFRQDLYYRLDVLRINIPPLRERLEDLPALVEHLLAPDRQGPGFPDRGRGHPDVPAARLAGERARVVPCLGAGLPGRLGAYHDRGPFGRKRRDCHRPGHGEWPLPGGDGSGRTPALGECPEGCRRQQNGSRDRPWHETLHFPRPARQARSGMISQ